MKRRRKKVSIEMEQEQQRSWRSIELLGFNRQQDFNGVGIQRNHFNGEDDYLLSLQSGL